MDILPYKKLGVLDQVAQATRSHNRLAFTVGGLLGGFIPVASFTICHYECEAQPYLWVLVVAGFTYSAITVYQWATIAFKHWAKAVGFVVLMEGVIFFSHTLWLSYAALGVLVLINGISTATNLIADRKLARRKR
jgi:VIT1/CCC1 family predicted Fe2+/Mn2+ transporter